MEEGSVPGLSTLQCVLCRKNIAVHGRINFEILNHAHMKNVGQNSAGPSKEHPTSSNFSKANFLGQGISAPTGGMGFPNLTDKFQTYLKDTEAQIRSIHNENYELKKAFTHLFSLVHTTNAKIHNSNTKLTGQVSKLAENLGKRCLCSIDLEARIFAVHDTAKVVEAKLERMNVDMKSISKEIKGGVERDYEEPAQM